MTANALAKAISARIEAAWEKMPDKEAPLTLAQVRELELDISDIMREAKREVCTHPKIDRDHAVGKPYCWDCCSLVEPKSEAKAGG